MPLRKSEWPSSLLISWSFVGALDRLPSVAVVPIVAALLQAVSGAADPAQLVQQLGAFPASIPAGAPSNGRLPAVEQQRSETYQQLRALDAAAVPALSHGLADADARVRRGVALYLEWAGGNYGRIAARPLDLRPYLSPLAAALRDSDQRVKELSAEAIGLIGPAASIAVPDLVRMLEDPAEGLRNTACVGLAGIGPPAKGALPALRKALADPSKDVRQFAQHAIDKIEGRQRGGVR